MPSKYEILSQIAETHPDLQHELAAKHNGVLVDLFCRVPRCDGRVLKHWVERSSHRDWSAENECRYVICPKCSVRGNWNVKDCIPPHPKQVSKAKKLMEDKASNARKEEVEAIDRQMAALQVRRDYLEPSAKGDFDPEQEILSAQLEPKA